jgi:uncharacterized protein
MASSIAASYDVAILGAGPGGLFAANEILNGSDNISLILIDKGSSIEERICPAISGKCTDCAICGLILGAGGAGLFSDGKLIWDIFSGSDLEEIISEDDKKGIELQIRDTIEKFAQSYIYKGSIYNFEHRSDNLVFKPFAVLHLGSENLRKFISNYLRHLEQSSADILFKKQALNIIRDNSGWLIELSDENSNTIKIKCRYLIAAVGKEGNFWLTSLVEKLGGDSEIRNTFVGIRMEIDNNAALPFYNISFNPKFSKNFANAKIKTHCFCRHGQVLLLKYFGLPVVGGHTPYIEIDNVYDPKLYPNSNFAILYRNKSLCTKDSAFEIMQKINKITQGNLLVQRLGDYLEDKPTDAEKLLCNAITPSNSNIIPGRISEELMPGFRDIFISFLDDLSLISPNILNPDNLLYAPAIEWWMNKINIDENMEVKGLSDLFAVGDGSGWTQGIVQSAAMGILAANAILEKESAYEGSKIICQP